MLHRWTVRGAERFTLPGAQQRHAHLEGRALYDAESSAFLDRFLGAVAGAAARRLTDEAPRASTARSRRMRRRRIADCEATCRMQRANREPAVKPNEMLDSLSQFEPYLVTGCGHGGWQAACDRDRKLIFRFCCNQLDQDGEGDC